MTKAKRGCNLLRDNAASAVAEDSRKALRKAGFSEPETDLFVDKIVGILDDYAAAFGEGKEIEYGIRRRLVKLDVLIAIPGEAFDPFTDGSGAQQRAVDRIFNLNLDAGSSGIFYRYRLKRNIICVSIPLEERPKKILKDPIVWSVILGLACGLLCKVLPQPAGDFLINKIASPLQSIILGMMSGVMGPVVFISLISSIIALESINDLTGLGFKVIGRFLANTLFLIAASILASGLLFRNFGSGDTAFSPELLFDMIFDIVPTNLIDPFLKSNTAQLVILGFLAGAGLLLLGDSVSELKRIIGQVNKWVMSVMNIILLTMPAIPFLSIMITLGSGKGKDLLSGWKFVAASYLAFTVCIAVKAVKTSICSGIGIPELWQKIKPAAKISFTTGSTTAAMKSTYEASEKLRIKESFSSFWLPMGGAMLSPKTAVYVVITAFMAAQLENTPVSYAFLVVLIIMATELSTASPGIPAACTALLKSLGLPIDYVGLVATYRLLTDNYGAACSISYNMLEEVEIAHKLGEIETDET
ncbi:MAG: cation:dicarboxylase symporter family transporter [Oscillospiraceae bacterium]|nr:cation:dicarboxylase symporter family transporter [Oscillospiraceae bacterium]